MRRVSKFEQRFRLVPKLLPHAIKGARLHVEQHTFQRRLVKNRVEETIKNALASVGGYDGTVRCPTLKIVDCSDAKLRGDSSCSSVDFCSLRFCQRGLRGWYFRRKNRCRWYWFGLHQCQ